MAWLIFFLLSGLSDVEWLLWDHSNDDDRFEKVMG
ncbi:hypothetical protein RSK20926_19827 [Roseobacter sp. SK209-2-6]|nr:hypothetical protein RSK20926_19827 [Roseobacter sp. SK209-2-6]